MAGARLPQDVRRSEARTAGGMDHAGRLRHHGGRRSEPPGGEAVPQLSILTLREFLRTLSRRQKSAIFLGLDLALVPIALILALGMVPVPEEALPSTGVPLIAVPYLQGVALMAFVGLGLHSRQLIEYDAGAFGRVAIAAVLVSLGGAALATMSGVVLPLSLLAAYAMTLFMMIAVSRIILLEVVRAIYRRGDGFHRVLIYGAGATGIQLVQALKSHRDIEAVAFVDDNAVLHGRRVSGLPVESPVRIAELARRLAIERVLLAVPSLTPQKQARMARRLQQLGLEVQQVPSFSQLIGTEALVDKLETVDPDTFLGRDEVQTPLDDVGEVYAGRSVLISGAGGSIGSELCRQAITLRPRRLVLYEMCEFALFTVDQELAPLARDAGVELIPVLGSVCDAERVRQVLAEREVEVILHAAAYKHVHLVQQNPLAGLSNNVLGTQVLLTEAIRAGVDRFTLISSDKAVRPRGVMGASKRLAELVVQDAASRIAPGEGPVCSMVRFGNVLGSSGSVVPIFMEQIRRGGPVTVTHPDVTRYFMTIQEATRLVLRAGAMAEGQEVFLLDMGRPVRIHDLAVKAIEAANYTLRDAANPEGDIEITYIGLREGEKIEEELFLDGRQIPTSHRKIYRVQETTLSQLETASVVRSLRRAVEAGDREAALDTVAQRLDSFRRARQGDDVALDRR
jgi:FlaA1/EpsC-like NDP-sugar epimerase